MVRWLAPRLSGPGRPRKSRCQRCPSGKWRCSGRQDLGDLRASPDAAGPQAVTGPPGPGQSRQLRKLDSFDFLLLDDLVYLPQANEESEVLFTLIAERYERRSLGITSNLVFSEWERIFANPMATATANDRVVHHSVILEFDVPIYRTDAAQQRGETAAAEEVNRKNSGRIFGKITDT